MSNLRLGIFIWLLKLIIPLVPKEAKKTWVWLGQLPWEEV